MGQRTTSTIARPTAGTGIPSLSIFPTNLGWFGLLGRDSRLVAVWVGHASAAEVHRAAGSSLLKNGDWLRPAGSNSKRSRFGDVPVPLFQRAAAADPAVRTPEFRETDWNPELRQRLERYCLGDRIDFGDIPLALPRGTDFQLRVLNVVRRVRYGKTISYGRLAEKAGYPRAARAVGSVMSSNRFPIVVPCHRVVAAGSKPGGYTSPQGISLKLRLLAMEAE